MRLLLATHPPPPAPRTDGAAAAAVILAAAPPPLPTLGEDPPAPQRLRRTEAAVCVIMEAVVARMDGVRIASWRARACLLSGIRDETVAHRLTYLLLALVVALNIWSSQGMCNQERVVT